MNEKDNVVEMPKKSELPNTQLTDSDIQPYIGSLVLANLVLRKENAILKRELEKKE